MPDFFRGWRRKIGCVMLVVASVLAVTWGRSFIIRDTIVFGLNGTGHYIVCTAGRIEWPTWWYADGHSPMTGMDWISGPEMSQPWILSVSNNIPVVSTWIVSYWWLVLPCSMLSAYLILWKPRKRV